jgi:hypothetical protein
VAVRPRFDPKRDFVAARGFTFAGTPHDAGDPFDKTAATPTRLTMLYESRMINFAPEGEPAPADPVTISQTSGGYFAISAPWLDTPIRARGKAKADETLAQVRKDGPPMGWIAGGTLTGISGGDGGWYDVTAPWLEEPERVQGREAAEARQRELHETGEPAYHHGVTLTPGENGWWDVSANWDPENIAKVQGEEAARDLATQWRADGPPADPVTVTAGADEGTFVITAAWLDEPVTVEGEEAATERASEIRTAGPPEGWEPDVPDEA